MYPFFAGLLLFRMGKLTKVKNGFFWCSLLTVVTLSIPRIGGSDHRWMNGLYDSLTIIFIFPLIVYLGASGTLVKKQATRICKFLGDLSYPIYMTHYPIIYIYTGWVRDRHPSFSQAFPIAALCFIVSVLLAWVCLKYYDEPVRLWLKKKFLTQ